MNKFFRWVIAIMGATNVVFSFFTPIAVAFIVILLFDVGGWRANVLLLAAMLSSVYRAINVGFFPFMNGE